MTSIHQYDDIMDLPHPDPKRHTRMSVQARAAQFMPFAALTGYTSVIEEITRKTEERPLLDESEKQRIGRKLRRLKNHPDPEQMVRITYFLPDLKKEGGSIETLSSAVKKVDEFARQLILADERKIPFSDLLEIGFYEKKGEDF